MFVKYPTFSPDEMLLIDPNKLDGIQITKDEDNEGWHMIVFWFAGRRYVYKKNTKPDELRNIIKDFIDSKAIQVLP